MCRSMVDIQFQSATAEIRRLGPLAAEICWRVWGTPAHFNGFRVLTALLHGTLVVGVNQTLRRWTEGTTYIRQGSHHVGHWPTFLVVLWFLLSSFFFFIFPRLISAVADWTSTKLAHMVWPQCKFRTQVWNVLHAAHWKIQDAKHRQKIHHMGTIAQLCLTISSQLRHVCDNRKTRAQQ